MLVARELLRGRSRKETHELRGLDAIGADPRPSLRAAYLPALERTLGREAARAWFDELLEQVERESRRAGAGERSARALLGREGRDSVATHALARMREEGIRDDDLRWWRGLPAIEQRFVRKLEEYRQAHAFGRLREEEEMSAAEAGAALRRAHPRFATAAPAAGADPGDPHRPLPVETWRRVEDLLARQSGAERETLLAAAREQGSLNAALRERLAAAPAPPRATSDRKDATDG